MAATVGLVTPSTLCSCGTVLPVDCWFGVLELGRTMFSFEGAEGIKLPARLDLLVVSLCDISFATSLYS